MGMLKWYFGTRAKYDALTTKNADGMYFLEDTGEIYYQGKQYMDSLILYTGDRPATGVAGKVYFNTTTLLGEVYKDGAWKTVVDKTGVAVLDENGAGVVGAVTGAAIKTYIDAHLKGSTGTGIVTVSYDPDTQTLKTVNSAGTEATSTIKSFAKSIVRDSATGDITLMASDGTTKLATINIPPDIHVTGGAYDETAKGIVLTMSNGSKVTIPSIDIVGLYNELDSKTINVTTKSEDGVLFIQMDVNVSATADNGLSKNADGLFYSGLGLVDMIVGGVAGDVVSATSDGNAKDSGVAIGGTTLAATPSDIVAALEASVATVKTDALTDMDAKYVKAANVRGTYAEFLAANGMTQA